MKIIAAKKLYILIFLFLVLLNTKANTFDKDERESFDYALGGSFLAAGVTFATVYHYFFLKDLKNIPTQVVALGILPCVVGKLTFDQLYNYLFQRALENHYLSVKKIIESIEKNQLLTKEFKSIEAFTDYLANNHQANNQLKHVTSDLKEASRHVQLFFEKLREQPKKYAPFEPRYTQLQEKINSWQAQFLSIINYLEYCALEENIQNMETDTIIQQKFETPESFITHLTTKFGTNWPLVLARDHITAFFKKLTALQSHLLTLSKYGPDFAEKCTYLSKKVQTLLTILEQKMSIIIHTISYESQVLQNEKDIIEKEKIDHLNRLQRQKLQHEADLQQEQHRHEKNLHLFKSL